MAGQTSQTITRFSPPPPRLTGSNLVKPTATASSDISLTYPCVTQKKEKRQPLKRQEDLEFLALSCLEESVPIRSNI